MYRLVQKNLGRAEGTFPLPYFLGFLSLIGSDAEKLPPGCLSPVGNTPRNSPSSALPARSAMPPEITVNRTFLGSLLPPLSESTTVELAPTVVAVTLAIETP